SFQIFDVDKTTPLIPELMDGWNKISDLMLPDYVMHPQLSLARMLPGEEMFVHSDSPGEDMEEDLTQIDLWSTCCILTWGLVAYFGEFTGGELWYSAFDITLPVNPGDLVIHSALTPYEHGVKEVKSGTRYAFSNFSIKSDRNPGTFYNHGTPESRERQKDYWNWMIPLKENPQFPQSEKLRSESREKYESQFL
ncbi:2OG-Fe(II) oxygenase, partial [bacterium]|nr:2OG-Fe(II) oxygenase [bacterium]